MLRRSALYVPGANERAMAKATSLPADVLILDLEDAVAPEAKVGARRRVYSAITQEWVVKSEVAVRINAPDTIWHAEDLQAVSQARPHAVVIPKINSAEDVRAVEHGLERAGASSDTRLWVMLETPSAIWQALSIATSSERVTVLVMGTNDLAKELHAEQVAGRQPLLFALSACVAAARCAGKEILDGVFNDIHDTPGFEDECRQARQLGFDGKTLIHPSQIERCNQVFSPRNDDISRARQVIQAYDAALARGQGVATLDGRLVERLHVDEARRVLALAEAIHSNSRIG